jgi:hypothetical protein
LVSAPLTYRVALTAAKEQAALGRTVKLQTIVNGAWQDSAEWTGADNEKDNGPLFKR